MAWGWRIQKFDLCQSKSLTGPWTDSVESSMQTTGKTKQKNFSNANFKKNKKSLMANINAKIQNSNDTMCMSNNGH